MSKIDDKFVDQAVGGTIFAMADAMDLGKQMRKSWTRSDWTEGYTAKVKARIANNNSIANTAGRVIVAAAVMNAADSNVLKGRTLEMKALRGDAKA